MNNYNSTIKYCLSFLDDVEDVIDTMLSMNKDIGDVWVWPDRKSSYQYALTEAVEYLECRLLMERPGDSRNNKQMSDFDMATELFDTFMMVLRGLMHSAFSSTLSVVVPDKNKTMLLIKKYTEANINLFSVDHKSGMFLERHTLASSVCSLLNLITSDENTVKLLIEIYSNPIFNTVSFSKVAHDKLSKILNKNLAKKAKMETDDVGGNREVN